MNISPARTSTVADAAAPIPAQHPTSATRVIARTRTGHALVMVIAALLAATTLLAGAPPAQAATYRDIRSVRYGVCAYNLGDPLEDFRNQKCGSAPTTRGKWTVTLVGYYNNHKLWVLHRQAGSCLGVDGTPGSRTDPYLYMSCDPQGSRNVWEIFTTGSRYVFKSFGAYTTFGAHRCLVFNAPGRAYKPQLGACSLTNTSDMIYQ